VGNLNLNFEFRIFKCKIKIRRLTKTPSCLFTFGFYFVCGNLGKDLKNFSYKNSGLARACIISGKRTAKDHCKALFTRTVLHTVSFLGLSRNRLRREVTKSEDRVSGVEFFFCLPVLLQNTKS